MASKEKESKKLRCAGVVFITLEFGISFKIITQLGSITMITGQIGNVENRTLASNSITFVCLFTCHALLQ